MQPDPALLSLRILAARRQRVGRDWAWDGVRSPFLRVYAVHGGEARLRIAGRSLHLVPGACALIPAGTIADYHCPDQLDHSWVHAEACYDGRDLAPWLLTGVRAGLPDLHAGIGRIPRLVAGAAADHWRADGILRQVLAAFLAPHPAAGHALEQVEAWARDHLAERLGLADLARISSCSQRELRRRFLDRHGLSPMAWLRGQRLAHAEGLLHGSALSVDAIAVQSGLGGRCQLSRLLRRQRGRSPRQLRRA